MKQKYKKSYIAMVYYCDVVDLEDMSVSSVNKYYKAAINFFNLHHDLKQYISIKNKSKGSI